MYWQNVTTLTQTIYKRDIDVEDSGMYKGVRIVGADDLYFDIKSYDEVDEDTEPNHKKFDDLIGKKVRITLEVMDD